MCSPAPLARPRVRLAALAVLAASAAGCGTVVDAAAGLFGPGGVGETVDAHVVYRLRPDCPHLLARTINNGYTVLRPVDAPPIDGRAAFVGTDVEESGLFEGPVRTGEVVFRYVPPAESATWRGEPIDVTGDVDAVSLTLEEGRDRLLALCGPAPATIPPDPTVPRFPDRPVGQ